MAVVGAGPAGSVCACSALNSFGEMRVALIDQHQFPRDKSCGDAIRDDAVSVLRELDIGAIFDGRPVIRDLQISFPPTFSYLEKVFGLQRHSYYVIAREVFDHYLYKMALQQGAGDYTGHRLIDANFDEAGKFWKLILKTSSGSAVRIRCKTLVGADGASSRVRRLAGLERQQDQHLSLGIRAYAQAKGSTGTHLHFDFLKSVLPGYGWVFPLHGGKVNIGVGIDRRDYKRAGRRMESYLYEYIRYLGDRDVALGQPEKIMTGPLPLASQAVPLVPKQRVALIGDAAAMIDPFSGEGIHFGIWAGRTLGQIIGQCIESGNDEDLEDGLHNYAKAYTERFARPMEFSETLRVQARFYNFFM